MLLSNSTGELFRKGALGVCKTPAWRPGMGGGREGMRPWQCQVLCPGRAYRCFTRWSHSHLRGEETTRLRGAWPDLSRCGQARVRWLLPTPVSQATEGGHALGSQCAVGRKAPPERLSMGRCRPSPRPGDSQPLPASLPVNRGRVGRPWPLSCGALGQQDGYGLGPGVQAVGGQRGHG